LLDSHIIKHFKSIGYELGRGVQRQAPRTFLRRKAKEREYGGNSRKGGAEEVSEHDAAYPRHPARPQQTTHRRAASGGNRGAFRGPGASAAGGGTGAPPLQG